MNPSKIKLVISDFHLSRGKWLKNGRRNPLEDFLQDEPFREFLDHYSTGKYAEADVELIVNGDFFDPLAVMPIPGRGEEIPNYDYPLEVEAPAAVEKFKTILDGHPVSVAGMKSFLMRGKKITFRWGNHDAALLWPEVQELIRKELAPPREELIEFQQAPYIFDRICVDHGHQHEYINQFDENNLFMDRKTPKGIRKIQNLPFGSFFVLGFINRIKLKRPYISQVYPLQNYLKLNLFVDPIFVIVSGIKVAWFFFKMRFITHPMRFARMKKTFLIFLELLHRPSLEEVAGNIFSAPDAAALPYDTIIMGHNHQAAVRVFPGGKQYINTGTWTPITSLEIPTLGHRNLRTYALIEYIQGKARASLKIWHGQTQVTEDFG